MKPVGLGASRPANSLYKPPGASGSAISERLPETSSERADVIDYKGDAAQRFSVNEWSSIHACLDPGSTDAVSFILALPRAIREDMRARYLRSLCLRLANRVVDRQLRPGVGLAPKATIRLENMAIYEKLEQRIISEHENQVIIPSNIRDETAQLALPALYEANRTYSGRFKIFTKCMKTLETLAPHRRPAAIRSLIDFAQSCASPKSRISAAASLYEMIMTQETASKASLLHDLILSKISTERRREIPDDIAVLRNACASIEARYRARPLKAVIQVDANLADEQFAYLAKIASLDYTQRHDEAEKADCLVALSKKIILTLHASEDPGGEMRFGKMYDIAVTLQFEHWPVVLNAIAKVTQYLRNDTTVSFLQCFLKRSEDLSEVEKIPVYIALLDGIMHATVVPNSQRRAAPELSRAIEEFMNIMSDKVFALPYMSHKDYLPLFHKFAATCLTIPNKGMSLHLALCTKLSGLTESYQAKYYVNRFHERLKPHYGPTKIWPTDLSHIFNNVLMLEQPLRQATLLSIAQLSTEYRSQPPFQVFQNAADAMRGAACPEDYDAELGTMFFSSINCVWSGKSGAPVAAIFQSIYNSMDGRITDDATLSSALIASSVQIGRLDYIKSALDSSSPKHRTAALSGPAVRSKLGSVLAKASDIRVQEFVLGGTTGLTSKERAELQAALYSAHVMNEEQCIDMQAFIFSGLREIEPSHRSMVVHSIFSRFVESTPVDAHDNPMENIFAQLHSSFYDESFVGGCLARVNHSDRSALLATFLDGITNAVGKRHYLAGSMPQTFAALLRAADMVPIRQELAVLQRLQQLTWLLSKKRPELGSTASERITMRASLNRRIEKRKREALGAPV